LRVPCIDGRIIIKLMLMKQDMKVGSGDAGVSTETSGRILRISYEPVISLIRRDFLNRAMVSQESLWSTELINMCISGKDVKSSGNQSEGL
jgi:hypothetical protein